MYQLTAKLLILICFTLIPTNSIVAIQTEPITQSINSYFFNSHLFISGIYVNYILQWLTVLSIVSGVIAWHRSPSKSEISKKITLKADYILSLGEEDITHFNTDSNFKVTEIKRMIIEATFHHN